MARSYDELVELNPLSYLCYKVEIVIAIEKLIQVIIENSDRV